jgi:hypothetical protein
VDNSLGAVHPFLSPRWKKPFLQSDADQELQQLQPVD